MTLVLSQMNGLWVSLTPYTKTKETQTQPENYKSIALLSCIEKLFTCILSDR